jgi:hypothetical protein
MPRDLAGKTVIPLETHVIVQRLVTTIFAMSLSILPLVYSLLGRYVTYWEPAQVLKVDPSTMIYSAVMALQTMLAMKMIALVESIMDPKVAGISDQNGTFLHFFRPFPPQQQQQELRHLHQPQLHL